MTSSSRKTPMDRFLRFMTADIEGDVQTADELSREMIDLKEVRPDFIPMRRLLRACRSVEELNQVYQSFS